MSNKKKPWSIYALMTLLLLLGLGGIGGGIALLADPSGAALGLPQGLLDELFIGDFFWPGVFLITAMGLGPYVVYYGVWQGLPWARTGVLAQAALLISWILLQIALWGQPILLQIVYLLGGIGFIVLAILPLSKTYFSRD